MNEQISVRFDGKTYEKKFDRKRLTGQLLRVFNIMVDKQWRTLGEIQEETIRSNGRHDSQAAISARLRDFRKERFGGFVVNRRRRGDPENGLFEYQLGEP